MQPRLKRFIHDNSLSLVLFFLFFTSFFAGEMIAGYLYHNDELRDKGRPEITFFSYIKSSDFLEATAENWESEFLQMFTFVILSALLFQRGSAESKNVDEPEEVDEEPEKHRNDPDAPWPVRRGGIFLTLYKHSLTLMFLILFLVSFLLHAVGGAGEYNRDQLEEGKTELVNFITYMGTSKFWFESFQNWQSEFLAIWAMVLFTIFLREKGSPESKPVHSPHRKTGKG